MTIFSDILGDVLGVFSIKAFLCTADLIIWAISRRAECYSKQTSSLLETFMHESFFRRYQYIDVIQLKLQFTLNVLFF